MTLKLRRLLKQYRRALKNAQRAGGTKVYRGKRDRDVNTIFGLCRFGWMGGGWIGLLSARTLNKRVLYVERFLSVDMVQRARDDVFALTAKEMVAQLKQALAREET